MTGRGAVSYRERFTLWDGEREVPGGPYFRPAAVERAAERVLAKFPRAALRITREELVIIPRPGGTSAGDVIRQWQAAGVEWVNPHGVMANG